MDLASAELVGSSKNENSLPGMVLNTKKPVVYVDDFGKRHRYIFHPKLVASVLKFTFVLLIYNGCVLHEHYLDMHPPVYQPKWKVFKLCLK